MKKFQLSRDFWVVYTITLFCFWMGWFNLESHLKKGSLVPVESIATAPYLLSEDETLWDLSEKLVSWRLCNDSKTALDLLLKLNQNKIDDLGRYKPGYYKVPILNHEEFLCQLKEDEVFRQVFTYPQWNKQSINRAYFSSS